MKNEGITASTNEYGGDTDWGDDPLPAADRGDSAEPDPKPTEEVIPKTEPDGDPASDGGGSEDPSPVEEDEDPADDEDDSEGGDTDPSDDEDEDPAGDEDEDGDTPKQNRVPVSRLNKEAQKRREAETRAKELEERIAELEQRASGDEDDDDDGDDGSREEEPELPFTHDEFKAMQDAMLDGESEQAMEHFAKMMAKQAQQAAKIAREQAREEARESTSNELNQREQLSHLETKAQELAARYPELDHTNTEYGDQALIEEVVDFRDYYISRGKNPADALEEAVDKVARINQLADRAAKPEAPAAPKKKPVDAKRKLAAAEKERGRLPGDGERQREEKIDWDTVTDEKFKSLSREALAKARGDYL